MAPIVFNGKEFANKIEIEVRDRVVKLTEKLGRRPKLTSIYNPNHEPSRIYTRIKEKKAGEMGIDFVSTPISNSFNPAGLRDLILRLNVGFTVDGIMIQLPLLPDTRDLESEIVELIDSRKDIDGLRPDSYLLPATVRAVIAILDEAMRLTRTVPVSLAVVGNKGTVGRRIEIEIEKRGKMIVFGMDREDFDIEKLKTADVVISATGRPGLITRDMVKDPPSPDGLRRGERGVIAIDVGSPQGDFDFASVSPKASFITPVPGGVGPVTVVSLFENLVEVLK